MQISQIPSSICNFRPEPIANLVSGVVSDRFLTIMRMLELKPYQHFPELDPNHILNWNEIMQNKCFHKITRVETHQSSFDMDFKRAEGIMDYIDSCKKSVLATSKEVVTAIVCSGVFPRTIEETLGRRLRGLDESIKQMGLQCRRICVMCKNEEIVRLSKMFIDKSFKFDCDILYLTPDDETQIGISCLEKLKSYGEVGFYAVITDDSYELKDVEMALSVLGNDGYQGYCSLVEFTWKQKMVNLQHPNAIVHVLTEMNILARAVHVEAQKFQVKIGGQF